MKTRIIVFVAICLLIIIGALVAWQRTMQQKTATQPSPTASSSPTLLSDALPLYSGVSWGTPVAADTTIGTLSLTGARVTSSIVPNVTDISSVSDPFESYYADRLSGTGWTVDQSLAAGGPGSADIGYKKGSEYILLGYHSTFLNVSTNTPAQCPCNVTFSVFSGTAN